MKLKYFKVHIDSVVAVSIEGLDFSQVQVEIKDQTSTTLRSLPLSQLSQTIVTVDSQSELSVSFCLLEYNPMGARQNRVFAEGKVSVQCQQFLYHEKVAKVCTIRSIITNKTVLTLAVIIKEDLQKKTYAIPESDLSMEQTDEQPTKDEPMKVSSGGEKSPKKLSPLKRAAKKQVRNRHFEYQVKSEWANVQLNNKVTDEESISVEDLKLDIDEAISSIQFYGQTFREMLAQVVFKNNPTEDDLKGLRIKVPESEKTIDIHLNTIEGDKLTASTSLPNISEKECLKICCDFRDKNNDVRGSMKFNYKETSQEQEGKLHPKMNMSEDITVGNLTNRRKEKIDFVPFFFSEHNTTIVPLSPSFKLPSLFKKDPNFYSLNIDKYRNERSAEERRAELLRDKPEYSNRSALEGMKSLRKMSDQIQGSRHIRSKTLHSRNIGQSKQPKLPPENRVSALKIMSISVKFHKSFLEREGKFLQKEPFVGKFLKIFSNPTQIYRSESVYSNSTLNWKLYNCKMAITECDNLTIQLNMEKEKALIGELVISYNQLRFNQEENFLYFGYLTHDYDTIGKINIQFLLQQDSNKQFPERRTQMRRLYSQQINLDQIEETRNIGTINENPTMPRKRLFSPTKNRSTQKQKDQRQKKLRRFQRGQAKLY